MAEIEAEPHLEGGKQIMTINSLSVEDTEMIGFMTGKEAQQGDIFCLSGELGAGKTAFARGLAKGLGYEGRVTSPTFSIMNEYSDEESRLTMYHFDLYRLESDADLESIGYEDYFFGSGVSLVEWPERAEEAIPENAVWFKISNDPLQGEDFREINII